MSCPELENVLCRSNAVTVRCFALLKNRNLNPEILEASEAHQIHGNVYCTYSSGRQSVGLSPIVDLVALFIEPPNTTCCGPRGTQKLNSPVLVAWTTT